jgi:hypothetical protein
MPHHHPDADWSETEGFRETFLGYFPAEDEPALRRLGAMLFEYALELGGSSPHSPEPSICRHLVAAARDLRHQARHLSWVSDTAGEVVGLPPDEATRLAELARQTADSLERLSTALEACRP